MPELLAALKVFDRFDFVLTEVCHLKMLEFIDPIQLLDHVIL